MDDLQNTEGFGWMAVSLGCATPTITRPTVNFAIAIATPKSTWYLSSSVGDHLKLGRVRIRSCACAFAYVYVYYIFSYMHAPWRCIARAGKQLKSN